MLNDGFTLAKGEVCVTQLLSLFLVDQRNNVTVIQNQDESEEAQDSA